MDPIIEEFRLQLVTAPQPVALALGRICRVNEKKDLIEAALKAGEVLARYTAALAVASICARDDSAAPLPTGLETFRGNLSFGHFLSVLKTIQASPLEHPLKKRIELARALDTDGELPFDALVGLRNELGHALSTLSEARAEQILERNRPVENLAAALKACQALLDLPLFLLEEQRMVKRVVHGRRLLLMGEAEPTPDFIDLNSALGENDRELLVALRTGALRLPPFLLWDIVEARESYGLYLLHSAEGKKLKYTTVHNDKIERTPPAAVFEALLNGSHRPLEPVDLIDGGDLFSEWLGMKRLRRAAAQPNIGPIPWSDLDDKTLKWYEAKLKGDSKQEGQDKQSGQLMVKRLLDGRTILSNDEIRQVVLLFGKEKAVSTLVKRALVDCRARKHDSDERWDEREESSRNVLESLRMAVEFFGRHVAIEGATLDGLQGTTGSADYIAMREALVNLFVHQDYTHPGIPGQVEIRDDRTIFYNAGASLVSQEGLLDGGKSTSRNAVVSRALKLIGFAELSGSGLYAVHKLWRKTHGIAPKIDSDKKANTFSLTFEWLLTPEDVDSFWKEKLGVTLSSRQAAMIGQLAKEGPLTLEQLMSANDLDPEAAGAALKYLAIQGFVSEQDEKFVLRQDIVDLASKR